MRLLLFVVSTLIAVAQTTAPYTAPTKAQRLKWATLATVGPPNLAAGVFTSAVATGFNNPPEYGPHWEGYGKRQALRLTGASTSNFMEAGLGAMWGEDPRYRRSTAPTVKGRVWHAVKTAFLAYDRDGHLMPAYARYISVPATNVLANTWRPDSQHTAGQTSMRVSLGVISRISSNTFAEFWPDIRSRLRRK